MGYTCVKGGMCDGCMSCQEAEEPRCEECRALIEDCDCKFVCAECDQVFNRYDDECEENFYEVKDGKVYCREC